jgi:lipid-A-disaccharide synthase
MISICVLTGEVSGEMHAAALIKEVKRRYPEACLFGMGSDKLEQCGVEIIVDTTQYSTVGFLEPIKYAGKFWKAYKTMKSAILNRKPDIVLAVDNQGFNMPLMKVAKKAGAKTAYYISPQEWHWGTEKGGRAVLEVTDKVIAIFKKEAAFYNRLGGDAVYVGHPLIDITVPELTQDELFKSLGIDTDTKLLTLFPGSRKQELEKVAPVLFEAAAKIQKRFPTLRCVVSIVKKDYEAQIKKRVQAARIDDPLYFYGDSKSLIKYAHFSLTTSGTICIEHALLKTPCVVAYKFNPITYRIAKKLMEVRLGAVPYMSMVNQFAEAEVQKEFLQDKATPEAIAETVIDLLSSKKYYDEYVAKLKAGILQLGEPGVISRAADALLSLTNIGYNALNNPNQGE